MADPALVNEGGQIAVNLTQLITLLFAGLGAFWARAMVREGREAKEAAAKLAERMDMVCQRWDTKRESCQLEADAKYARRDELDKLHNSVTNNFNAVYTRLRDTEQTATEARAFSSGVEKTVAALCGDK